jgi:DNA mismatch repair ATPase MutS
MQRVKTQNALVVPRTMATSHFDHSKSFRPYWENIIACSYGLLELSQVANRFERSIEAISRKFVRVLDSGNLLAKDLIKQETETSIQCILNVKNPCFTPHFNNCRWDPCTC